MGGGAGGMGGGGGGGGGGGMGGGAGGMGGGGGGGMGGGAGGGMGGGAGGAGGQPKPNHTHNSTVSLFYSVPMKLLHNLSSGAAGASLSPAAVRDIVRRYGAAIGIPDLAPHDLRRTYAKLSRLGGAPLETIQKSLGHATLRTTECYLATGEEANAGDWIKL